MLRTPPAQVLGAAISQFLPDSQAALTGHVGVLPGQCTRGDGVPGAGRRHHPSLKSPAARCRTTPPGSICLVATDLTAQKQAEAEIRQLNQELEAHVRERTLESSVPIQRWWNTRSCCTLCRACTGCVGDVRIARMCYLNASKRWLRDYRLESMCVVCHTISVFPEIPARWKDVHARALAGEVIRMEEDPFVREDGRTQWLKWEVRPWYDVAGAVAGIMIFTEDITERKEAQGHCNPPCSVSTEFSLTCLPPFCW